MRTVFVNPRRRRKRRRSNPRRRRSAPATTHRKRTYRRRRRPEAANPRRRRTYRRRRRNAGVTSFTRQNPLILSNPRRRPRRRNPSLNFKQLAKNTAISFGGGAVGYAINQFGLSQIQNDWVRRGSQVVLAAAGSYFLKGTFGASFAGATMYPLIADLAMYTGLVAVPTADELDELSADLEAALEADLGDDELYIDDFEPMYDESLVEW